MDNTDKVIALVTSKPVSTLTTDDIASALESQGVTLEALCSKLKEGLSSQKAIMNKFGDVSYEEDRMVQHKYMVTGLEMMKLLEKKTEEVKAVSVQVNFLPGDIDRMEIIARELKGLEHRLSIDKTQRGKVIDVTVS